MCHSLQVINGASDTVLKLRTHKPVKRPQWKPMSGEPPSAAAWAQRPVGPRRFTSHGGSPGSRALRKMDVTVEVRFKS